MSNDDTITELDDPDGETEFVHIPELPRGSIIAIQYKRTILLGMTNPDAHVLLEALEQALEHAAWVHDNDGTPYLSTGIRLLERDGFELAGDELAEDDE